MQWLGKFPGWFGGTFLKITGLAFSMNFNVVSVRKSRHGWRFPRSSQKTSQTSQMYFFEMDHYR
jgi:hypothetical protein